LHGLPILIKDNIDTVSMPTTAGSLALADTYASADAPVVQQLKQAGALILGKTNLSEWANFRSTRSSSGWSSVGGQVRNAHDITRTPGGSSSGSAVAVALGFCAGAIGTETDGSIVGPAAMNGIVGIKPSLGLVDTSGIIPIAASQDTAGPMTRTVDDARQLLSAMLDPGTEAGQAMRLALQSTRSPATALRGTRIGVARTYCGYHDELDEVFDAALNRMTQAGAILVDPVAIAGDAQLRTQERVVMAHEFKVGLNAYLGARTGRMVVRSLEQLIAFNASHCDTVMPYFKQELLEAAVACGPLTEPPYIGAQRRCLELARGSIDAAHTEYALDAIVAPTASPAWCIDWVCGDNRKGGASAPAAVAGYPHVTVPMGFVRHLPVGLSLFTSAMRDAQLIQLAAAYEHIRDA
jgi:Asp-tRNA(Asn)/Glu-tRNA(Gln) amidotransferase A subunit family amidase